MKINLWFCVAVLLIFIKEAACDYRCYVCTTVTGPYSEQCGDDFRLTSTSTSYCEGSCRKTRGYRSVGGRREVEVTRGCVPYTEETCYEGNHDGISADICICNEELCNNAPGRALTKWTGLVIGLCSLVIKFIFTY